jgi:hypothetical protein
MLYFASFFFCGRLIRVRGTDPEKQFLMLMDHIHKMRSKVMWAKSNITVFVEHNLGFEAEHHERALRHLPGVTFYKDVQRQRVGILTTLQIKHAMCTLTNAMLREKRISLLSEGFVSRDSVAMKRLLMEELETYSYQFKVTSPPLYQPLFSWANPGCGCRGPRPSSAGTSVHSVERWGV